MISGPAREMTLNEVVDRLPKPHGARDELQSLRTALAESQGREVRLREALTEIQYAYGTPNDEDVVTTTAREALAETPTSGVGVLIEALNYVAKQGKSWDLASTKEQLRCQLRLVKTEAEAALEKFRSGK